MILWNASSSKPTSSKTSNVIDPAEGSRPRLGLVATPTFAPMKQDHKSMRPTILAMDLEGTLISNAVSQIPRPGLYQFLESAKCLFDELVIFTTVPEPKFRQIADLLTCEGAVPSWFGNLAYTRWTGPTKDLSNASADIGSAWLLDDYAPYVHPGQEQYWVQIELFGSPYQEDDTGLDDAMAAIRKRLRECL